MPNIVAIPFLSHATGRTLASTASHAGGVCMLGAGVTRRCFALRPLRGKNYVGRATVRIEYATDVKKLLFDLSLASYSCLRVQQNCLNRSRYSAKACKTPTS